MKTTLNIFPILLIVSLSACAPPPPLHTSIMQPNDAVYTQVNKAPYLKGKIALAGISAETQDADVNALYANASLAAQSALTKAGLMAESPNAAPFVLSGTIKDVGTPRCFFGTCESGSSVQYSLINTKTKQKVYSDLLVVPYTMQCPVFMDGAQTYATVMNTFGGAYGNNLAQLIQVLSRKTKEDLK